MIRIHEPCEPRQREQLPKRTASLRLEREEFQLANIDILQRERADEPPHIDADAPVELLQAVELRSQIHLPRSLQDILHAMRLRERHDLPHTRSRQRLLIDAVPIDEHRCSVHEHIAIEEPLRRELVIEIHERPPARNQRPMPRAPQLQDGLSRALCHLRPSPHDIDERPVNIEKNCLPRQKQPPSAVRHPIYKDTVTSPSAVRGSAR